MCAISSSLSSTGERLLEASIIFRWYSVFRNRCIQLNTTELRQLLVTRFSEGELRDLCVDLGIDYEILPGQSKADKARELVAYFERRGRIIELETASRKLRPNADWHNIPLQSLQTRSIALKDWLLIILTIISLVSIFSVIWLSGTSKNLQGQQPSPTTVIAVSPPSVVDTAVSTSSLQGKIVFASDRDADKPEIYVADADGKNITRLTNNNDIDDAPTWSNDGQRIAFQSQSTEDVDIVIMNSDGKNMYRITNKHGKNYHPVWSSNGQLITFHSNYGSSADNYNIFIAKSDGSEEPRQITFGEGKNTDPSWPRSDCCIAFVAETSNSIQIINYPDGTLKQQIPSSISEIHNPRWSYDNMWIVFEAKSNGHNYIYKVHVNDNSAPIRIGGFTAFWPVWSHDNQKIVFQSDMESFAE